MQYAGDDDYASPLASLPHPRLRHTNLPYNSSIAACATASATSVWSGSSVVSCQSPQSSQSSQSSQYATDLSDYASCTSSQTSMSSVDSCDVLHLDQQKLAAAQSWQQQQQQQQQKLPSQLRQNARRTAAVPTTIASTIGRNTDRRSNFVDHLVDASTQIVQAIWPLSSVVGRGENGNSSSSSGSSSYLLPLRTFIQETLRRSRASYSTLQVALYYLLLIKPRLPSYNFTMEQPSDTHACRALQCGRRMFLAALILASKYLQDRNYSARAWSKISGLTTTEINQNETAFLHAVNWRLHITFDIYNRWIDCVSKFNPPQMPPSPGPAVVECFEAKCEDFRQLIRKLTPSLDNLDELCQQQAASLPLSLRRRGSFQMANAALSPVSLYSSPGISSSNCSSPLPMEMTPRSATVPNVPAIMEPSPASPTVFTPRLQAPALGLLPTPKLAPPQPGTFAPACSATGMAPSVSQILSGSRPSMCYAVAQASNTSSTQILDRWPGALTSTSSPVTSIPARRSSLANSVSTASSPESMISDSSLVSRCSSSTSSSWSSMNATSIYLANKVDAQVRHRFAKQACGGNSLRDKSSLLLRPSVIPVVLEDDEPDCDFSQSYASQETAYTGPVGRRMSDVAAADAARTLAELQQQQLQLQQQQSQQSQLCEVPLSAGATSQPKCGLKRSRPLSMENALQENVRELLRVPAAATQRENQDLQNVQEPAPLGLAANSLVTGADMNVHVTPRSSVSLPGSRKRLCRNPSTVAPPTLVKSCSYNNLDLQHPSMSGLCGPGMWQGVGILNN